MRMLAYAFALPLLGVFVLLFTLIPVSHVAAQTCINPPSGLVSWWPGDGNADDLQEVNDGTLQGGATFAAGMVGQAFSLNGVDAFVEAAENGSLDFNGPFSIDLWVKPNGPTPDRPLFSKYDFSGSVRQNVATHLTLRIDGHLQFGVNCATNMFRRTVPGVLPPDVFSHVAAVYRNSPPTLEIYVNGVWQDGTTLGSCTVINQHDIPFRIGKRIDFAGPRFFHGLIDEVEVFDRALTAGEIFAIYDAGSAGKCKPFALDHFQCYQAKSATGESKFGHLDVDLDDQFGATTKTVTKPEFLCTPVSKDGEPVIDPAGHLVCYEVKRLRGQPKFQKRDVLVFNQFEDEVDGRILTINEPRIVCVPSEKQDLGVVGDDNDDD